jgi:DNA-binding NtrC family response regulator
MNRRPRVLVVDDDRAVRTVLRVNLSKREMDVHLAEQADEALAILHEQTFDLVLTDVKMPGSNGIEMLRRLRERWPELPVVIMTGQASVADAVAAMKAGAADYVIKPVERDELYVILDRALERSALRAEVEQLRHQVQQQYGFENIIGVTPVMRKLYDDVAAVADTSATVLLEGPTGTGKELLAHALHYRSPRARGPFIRINCGAIPEPLLESELFGHEKGAFTGAVRQHIGKFEQADGGTLLLDEIGEVSPSMQVKLLRILENGEFQRVGGQSTVKVDVRIVAATHRSLRDEVTAGRFREDLYYRLHVVALRVPRLAERREDIPLLVDHFLRRYAQKNQRTAPRLAPGCVERLQSYPWPGNVRQLEHTIERAMVLHRDDGPLDIALPGPAPGLDAPASAPERREAEIASLPDALEALERRRIIEALETADGVQAHAARILGISRSNLNYRIHRLNIRRCGVRYE